MLLLFAIELCVAIVHLGCIVRGDTHSSSVELIPLTNGLAYIEIRSSSRERAILQRRRADHNYLPRSWMTLEKWLTASTVDRLTVSLNNGDWNPRWVSNQTHPHIHESPRGLRFEAYVNSKTAGRAYENCGDSSQTSITALSLAHRLFGIQRFSYNFRDVADVSAVEIRLNSSHQEFISHDNSSGDSSCTAMGKCDMIQRVGAPSNVAQIMHYTSTEERLNSASTKKFISTEADHLSSLSHPFIEQVIRTAPWIEVSWSYALLGKEEQLQGNIDLSSTTITSYRKSLNLRLVAPHDELDRLKSYWKDAKSAEAREIHSEMSGVSIFIGKSVEDSRSIVFSVTTSYELKARAALDKYNGEQLSLQILETVPIHYELFSHSVTYRICVKPDGDWSCGKPIQPSQLLGNLNFGNNQQLHMQRLSRHFYFNVSVPVNGRLVVHFQARKSFLRRHEIPPDASRGIVLHPSEAYYVDGNGRIHTFQSQALLLQAPTPDMSMPYNVITLFNALSAFLVGSMLNAFIRKTG